MPDVPVASPCLSFAVVPDHSRRPAASFQDIEDAIEWGLLKYGGDRFAIRRIDLASSLPESTPLLRD
jgi:hypothetical protein